MFNDNRFPLELQAPDNGAYKDDNFRNMNLSEKEFIDTYCHNCGSQRCEGPGTEWFSGCKNRFALKSYFIDNSLWGSEEYSDYFNARLH